MVTFAFIKKELVEHGLAIAALIFAVICALFITLARHQNQEFSISPLEILSYSLYTFIPLAAFILGNRLIVRDYRSRAQQFTESLPTARFVPVFVKYFVGAFVVTGLMLVTLLMASRYASVVDSITPEYFGLLALKTLSLALLYWSVMFAISLSGHLRLLLYVILIGCIYYLLTTSSIDVTNFGPFALLLDGTLVYERLEVPITALRDTWLLTAAFTLIGFIIALWQEGSMAEVLSRPMARRDYLLVGFILAAFATVLAILEKEPTPDPFPIATQYRVESDIHDITVAYLDPDAKEAAQPVLDGLTEDLNILQANIGPVVLPPSYVVHENSLATWEFIASSADGPLLYGNLLAADHYDRVVFRTTVLHQLLLNTSGGRAVFEHFHWFLDGYTRRIVESNTAVGTLSERNASQDELLARAAISLQVLGDDVDLINQWQTIADRVGYASAEALAYSALLHLEEQSGTDAIDELAKRWLATLFESDTRASIRRWQNAVTIEFKDITGLEWNDFMGSWRSWLSSVADQPEINERLAAIPYRAGAVHIVETELDGQLLLGAFAATNSALPDPNDYSVPDSSPSIISDNSTNENSPVEQVCVLNYGRAGPFDTEMDFIFDTFTELPCTESEFALSDYNVAGSGDRIYMTVEVRSPEFHQPIRLHAERVTSP